MKKRNRIAICDLLIFWPPDNGAFVDVYNVASFLAQHAEVLLITPSLKSLFRGRRTPLDSLLERHSNFFRRGEVSGDLPFRVERVPFSAAEFGPRAIAGRYARALDAFNPHKTFITSGWHLKVHLARDLARFNPIVRMYNHEFLCPKGAGSFFRAGEVCERDFIGGGRRDYHQCLLCCGAFLAEVPAVRVVQEYLRSGAFLPGYQEVAQQGLRAASAIIVNNQWIADRTRRFNKNVHVIPAGVDTELFVPPQDDARREEEEIVVVVPGRISEREKGRDFLKEVVKIMKQRCPEAVFWVTGTETCIAGENVKEVGWYNQDDLPKLYQGGHLAFIPSLWPEPYGIVALEAAACGLPCVVTAVGGLKDLVEDGQSGFVVPPGDVDRAVEALCRLAQDEPLRRSMGARGRKQCEEKFTWEKILEEHYPPLFLENIDG